MNFAEYRLPGVRLSHRTCPDGVRARMSLNQEPDGTWGLGLTLPPSAWLCGTALAPLSLAQLVHCLGSQFVSGVVLCLLSAQFRIHVPDSGHRTILQHLLISSPPQDFLLQLRTPT